MKTLLVIAIFSFGLGQVVGDCRGQPTLPAGSKWVANANCPKGGTYKEVGSGGKLYQCHCWCHKGYICDPKNGTATTTKSPSKKCPNRKPPVPAGSKWVDADNCPKGGVYTDGNYRCHCWCHKGYICDPKKAPKTTTAKSVTTTAKPVTTTKEPCKGKTPPVPAGSKWVPSPNCPSGPTYNNPGNGGPPYHCHCWCHKGYICDPKPTPSTTTSTTAASTTTVPTTTAGITTAATTTAATTTAATTTAATTTAATTTAATTTAATTTAATTTAATTTAATTTAATTTAATTTAATTVAPG